MRQAARADSEAVGAVGKGASGEARSRGRREQGLRPVCVSLFGRPKRSFKCCLFAWILSVDHNPFFLSIIFMFKRIQELTEQLTKFYVLYQVNQIDNVIDNVIDKKLTYINLKSQMSGRLFCFQLF